MSQTPVDPAVFVTDGDQRSALAITRSLGRRGVPVIVGESFEPCLAGQSKYCRRTRVYRSATDDPNGFVADMQVIADDPGIGVIIPATDKTMYLVSKNYDQLSENCKLASVDWRRFEEATDKGALMEVARSLKIPCPKSWRFTSAAKAEEEASSLPYPIVIKPCQSARLSDNEWISGGVSYAYSPEELLAALRDWPAGEPLPVIQERITGAGKGAFFLYDKGHEVAFFFHRRLREKPPSGGVSTLREAIEPDREMHQYSRALLEHLKWDGVAMVEFKIDDQSGMPHLMEINPRFWGSLQLAIDAGVDFPWLVYRQIIGDPATEACNYRVGTKSRWELGDLDHLLLRLFKSDAALRLPSGAPGRLATIWSVVRPGGSMQRGEIFRWDDAAPFWYELRSWFEHLRANKS